MTEELVHFPSSRDGFTWCGLRINIPRSMGISDGAQRSADGLLFATNMPVVTCPGCGDVPEAEESIDDLAAVASRINKRLNDLYFNETHKAMAIGVWRPGAYVHESGDLVVLIYNPSQDDVFYMLKERAARAYDRWLAAGNVGRHYEGPAMREEIAREMKR